jgi:hypothetical protein
MKVRELLRYELWSKGTTRKILASFGIVVGLLILGFFVWYEIEIRWLTTGERNAARAALLQVDALESGNPATFEELQIQSERTEDRVKAAETAARTIRDKMVHLQLYWYFSGVDIEQRERFQDRFDQEKHLTHLHQNDEEQRKQIDSLMRELTEKHRLALHKELD